MQAGGVLLSRRLQGAHLAGMWEFPGGKVEAGESPRAGLQRELQEELGIVVHVGDCIDVVHHVYEEAEREVILIFFACTLQVHSSPPRALQVAEFVWVAPEQLGDYALPPADAPVLDRVRDLLRASAHEAST